MTDTHASEPIMYIGDGATASWDGIAVVLSTPRENGDHVIYLEPEVLQNLFAFIQEIEKTGMKLR